MKKVIGLLAAFALCSGVANANESGLYFGAGIGKATVDFSALTTDTDTAFQAFGGFSINKNLNAEITYLNFGKVYVMDTAIKNSGVAASLMGILPLPGNAAIFGRFGYASIDTEAPNSSETRSDLMWGVGGQLDFSPESSFRLEYNNYAAGDKQQEDGNIGAVNLAILFRF